jgi:hypothetical protein
VVTGAAAAAAAEAAVGTTAAKATAMGVGSTIALAGTALAIALWPSTMGEYVVADPNNGRSKPHGGELHDRTIDEIIDGLKRDPSVTNIRKNQVQVDIHGNRVGNNRPDIQHDSNDIQYDKGGKHVIIEVDNIPKNSDSHVEEIQKNDPNAVVVPILL